MSVLPPAKLTYNYLKQRLIVLRFQRQKPEKGELEQDTYGRNALQGSEGVRPSRLDFRISRTSMYAERKYSGKRFLHCSAIRLTILVFGLLVCSQLFLDPRPAVAYQLTILHTNDQHGHFAAFDCHPFQDIGGMAAQSTLVNTVRAEVEAKGGDVLLLSAGDVNTGVPESDLLDARPDFELMGRLRYDAMVPGNHEFDNPLAILKKQRQWAGFPFLAANVLDAAGGETIFDACLIKTLGEVRVGILGLTTARTPQMVLPENIKGLRFHDPLAVAAARVPKLRQEVDLLIALTHLGLHPQPEARDADRVDDRRLAEEVPGIDVIVGGHSHSLLRQPVTAGRTLIVQAGEWSRYVGRLDLHIEKGQIVSCDYALLPVNLKKTIRYRDRDYTLFQGQAYVPDPSIAKAVAGYMAEAGDRLGEPVGRTDVFLDGRRDQVRFRETNLSRLITESMRARTGADMAFQNGGGIRDSIAPGLITYRDLLRVLPFGNTIVDLELQGSEILDMLRHAAAIEPGQGGFLHAAGLSWKTQQGKPIQVRVHGRPLKPDRRYSAATNSFLAAGGDGYALLADCPQYDTGYLDVEVLREAVAAEMPPF